MKHLIVLLNLAYISMLCSRWKKTRQQDLIAYQLNSTNHARALSKMTLSNCSLTSGKVDIGRLNYGIITLLPKVKKAAKTQQFRPICLLNYLYKLITKVLTLRIEHHADKLIHLAQSAFMKRRNIMSGILTLHEILHETKVKKEVGIILKLDFEKAYDKVN